MTTQAAPSTPTAPSTSRTWKEFLTPSSVWVVITPTATVSVLLTGFLSWLILAPPKSLTATIRNGDFNVPRSLEPTYEEEDAGKGKLLPRWIFEANYLEEVTIENTGSEALTSIVLRKPDIVYAELIDERGKAISSISIPDVQIGTLQPAEKQIFRIWSSYDLGEYSVTHDKGFATIIDRRNSDEPGPWLGLGGFMVAVLIGLALGVFSTYSAIGGAVVRVEEMLKKHIAAKSTAVSPASPGEEQHVIDSARATASKTLID